MEFLITVWYMSLRAACLGKETIGSHAAPIIGDGLLEYMSGLIGLIARISLLNSGVYALVNGLTVIGYAPDNGLTDIFPAPICDFVGIGKNMSGYMLAPALRLLGREEGGCAEDGWERGRRASWERGGDSGILSLLRVSLRARRLGRSGGVVGVNIGAESMDDGEEYTEEDGDEYVDEAVVAGCPGVEISGMVFERVLELVLDFGKTIEYRKCLCILSQHGEDILSPILTDGRELHAEIGVCGVRGDLGII